MTKSQSEEHFRVDVSSLGDVKLEDLKFCKAKKDYVIVDGVDLANAYVLIDNDELTEGWYLHESLKDFQQKTGEVEFLLKRFEPFYTSVILDEMALKWALENGCRAAFPSERNAFFLARPDIPTTADYDWVIDLGSWSLYRGERRYMTIKQSESTKTPTRLLGSTAVHLPGGPHHRCLFVKI